MAKRTFPPEDHNAFSDIPVQYITCTNGRHKLAVHISGTLQDARLPLICLTDYCRNMADYVNLLKQMHHHGDPDWPIVLIDLAGHGRSNDRKNADSYSTTNDAADIAHVTAALGIERGIFLGQGHGGHIVMALGGKHCQLIGGSILIDAAPVINAPGLVRLRDNLKLLLSMKHKKPFNSIARQVVSKAHPGATEEELDAIVARMFFWGKSTRPKPIFDPALLNKLDTIQIEDVFEPQWSLFDMLDHAPMMLIRTQLTDQLGRATFKRMKELRADAVQLVIPGQGTPALLENPDEVGTILGFVKHASGISPTNSIVAG